MQTLYQYGVHQVIIPLALLITLACVPTTAFSACDDHNHPQDENEVTLPDFGFSLGGTCDEPTAEAAPAKDSEIEDDLLKDIEEPLDDPPSDLAATLEEKGQAS